MRIPGTGITTTPDRLVVRPRVLLLSSPFLGVVIWKVAADWREGGAHSVEALGGFAVVLLFAVYSLIRLSADASGIRVLNGLSTRIPWADVATIEVAESSGNRGTAHRVQIRCTDGRVIKPMVPLGGLFFGYSFGDVERVVQWLLRMRRQALQIPDSPELADALVEAENGNPGPMDHLLASKAIDPEEYSARLHELADAGQVDLEALRRARRAES